MIFIRSETDMEAGLSCNLCSGRKSYVIEFKSDDPNRRSVTVLCLRCAQDLAVGLVKALPVSPW